jgi:hypothetical protein
MRPRTRHDRLPERMWVTPAIGGFVVAALLATTLVLPTVSDRSVILAVTVVVAVALLGALTLAWPSTNTRGPLNTAGQLVLHLTPVLLLTTVFPLVDSDISSARISGVSLTSVVLASSMTVPWLSQSVCMPLYRGIGDTLHRGDRDALLASFCRAWSREFGDGWAGVNFNESKRRKVSMAVPPGLRTTDGEPAPAKVTLQPHEGVVYRR